MRMVSADASCQEQRSFSEPKTGRLFYQMLKRLLSVPGGVLSSVTRCTCECNHLSARQSLYVLGVRLITG
eukprot:SAG31_NODE_41974_length_273_cov_1.195402_1_plen_69_part_10